MTGRPPAFVHVDVDGLWAVRACYGRAERDTFREDPVWREGVPRLARMFSAQGIPAAFFVVGRDLEIAEKATAAAALWRDGFEAGNHTYSHTIGITDEPTGWMLKEIGRTDLALRATGAKPVGFRAPGYDVDARLLQALRRVPGYLYDASVLPTRLGPVLRMAARWIAGGRPTPPRQFGRMAYALAPRAPYFPAPWRVRERVPSFRDSRLVEIPVGVTRGWRLPVTGGLLLSRSRRELRALFAELAATRRPLLVLLHGIDAVDCRRPIVLDRRRTALGGFAMAGEEKERRLRAALEELSRHFDIAATAEWARAFAARG